MIISTLFKALGISGVALITLGVLFKKKQDWLFLPGGICLLAYSMYIKDTIFIVLQSIYILAVIFDLWNLKGKK